jgi:hypothetical protein
MSPEDSVNALATSGPTLEDDVREMDYKAQARMDLIASLPNAVQALTDIALHGSNENARIKASTYIIERVLGPSAKNSATGDGDPITDLVNKLTQTLDEPAAPPEGHIG